MKYLSDHLSAIMSLLFAFLILAPGPVAAEPKALWQIEHVHGIAMDPDITTGLLLATHTGLFSATQDGSVDRVSETSADMMSFATDPNNPKRLFASGHPENDGNIGVMISEDAGKTWARIADGVDGPVDFHSLTISPMDSDVLYGNYKGLQKSKDGGLTWQKIGNVPEGTFSIAASATNRPTLYAASIQGFFISRNEGKTWEAGMIAKKPATMVHVTPQGTIYLFVYGMGLLTASEPNLTWSSLSQDFQDRALMSLVLDPENSDRLFAVADTGTVMASNDGGVNWRSFEGFDYATRDVISRGEKLYVDNCQQCHGVRGIGERPEDPNAKDEYGFVAPALNDDAHGWHHSDQQIAATILNGSPRNERMIAWNQILSEEDAKSLVAYIKSLWNFRSTACQGSKHMACMR